MAAGMVWAGARHLNRRRTVGAVGIVASGIFLLGLTFLVSLEEATVLKTAGLIVFSSLGASSVRAARSATCGEVDC